MLLQHYYAKARFFQLDYTHIVHKCVIIQQ